MEALLRTECHKILVDEPVDTVPAKIVLSPQRALLEERYLIAYRRLKIGAYHEDGAFGFTWQKFLQLQVIARVDRMGTVTGVLVQFRIGVDGHPIGGSDKTVARIVFETGPMAHDRGMPLDPRNSREHSSREGEIRRALLQLYIANPLADSVHGHVIRVDTEPPVGP